MFNADSALNGGETLAFSSAGGASPSIAASDCVVVPDAHLLFNGEFQRVGSSDLKIVGSDGESFFIENYFGAEHRANLMSPEGALLTANIVAALAGPLAPGQTAQASAQPAGQPVIGRVEAVTGSATVIRNGVAVSLSVGDTVRKGDVVQTSGASSVAIVFADGSTFSLSANARMVLDDFVYSAGASNNSALISLVQGTFSFVAGQVAKNGDMRVETPVATMGIRGTAVLVEITAIDGRTRFSVMVEPDGTTGSYNLYNKTTGALIGTVNNSAIGWVVTPAGPQQVIAQQVPKTPGELQQELGIIQQIFTIFNNNQLNPFTPQNDPDRRGQNPNDLNTTTTGTTGSGTLLDNDGGGAPTTPTGGQQTIITVTVTQIGTGTDTESNDTGIGTGDVGDFDNSLVITVETPDIGTFTIINGNGTITGTAGVDHIFGSSGNDIIDALAGDDQVFAGGGDDTVIAGHGEGNDVYDGETGFDTITFTSSLLGVFFDLNIGGVNSSAAYGVETGHDIFMNFEKIVAGSGNDIFVLHSTTHWEIDAGAGIDTVRLLNGVDFFGPIDGPDITNFEILDLWTDISQNIVEFDIGDFDDLGNSVPFRILGGQNDIINLTNFWNLSATWQQVADNTLADGVFADGLTNGVMFDAYEGHIGNQTFLVYVQDGVVIALPADAHDDQASMAENDTVFVDALVNDTGASLSALGAVTISGPDGVTLGNPVITIENNQIKIVAGTAFDALAQGETATITIPYTMQTASGETATATATVTVTGTNDAPFFSSLTGYSRTATDDDAPVVFNLLDHAEDADDHDALSAVNIVVTGHDQFGNVVNIAGAVTTNGANVTIDPGYFQLLTEGQTVTVTVDYDLSDGHALVHNTATLVVNGTGNGAQDDTASMTENEVTFIDVLANDAVGASGQTLTALGSVIVTGPSGVTLGNPAVVIENNQIRITPGTAFDALAEGETATITIPYTMQTASGEASTATATVTVTGTNDAPHFSMLPGFESLGAISQVTFGGVDALQLTSAGASQSQIEQFLGLTAGTLDTLEADTTDGAAIAFDLFLAANETIAFSWNFASTEYEPYNDYAFFSVSSNTAIKLSDIFTIGDSANDGFLHSSGWQEFTFTADNTADYRFGIGVMNEGDTAFDSFLYISGFSGLGFYRATNEDGPVETFDLLNGAFDPDTHDVLSATNIVATGYDQNGNVVNVAGAITIDGDGNSVAIDPAFFNALNTGQTVTVVVNYDLFDGHMTTHNSATLVVAGEDDLPPNQPPLIVLDGAQTGGQGNSTTLSGLSVVDADAAPTETFHVTAVATHGTLNMANPTLDALDADEDANEMSFDVTLTQLNQALQQGVTYTDPQNQTAGLVETVTLTVADGHGGVDAVNFIFNVFGDPNVPLSGTAGKDMLFGTGYNDTMTGGAGADIFAFGQDGPNNIQNDTITDFVQGQDKIAIYGIYSSFEDMSSQGAFTNLGPNQIDLGNGQSITLNVLVGSLTANDFILHG